MSAPLQLVDAPMRKWDEVLAYLESGGDRTYGFLQLAESDLQAFVHEVACPYCKKQITTEVQVIGITLQFSRLANEWAAAPSLWTRLGIVGRAVPMIAKLAFLELTKTL